jgi:hypothetical protein
MGGYVKEIRFFIHDNLIVYSKYTLSYRNVDYSNDHYNTI